MQNKFRIVTWDIETSELKGNLGVIISSVIKPLGEDPVVHTNKNLGTNGLDDKEICLAIKEELSKADVIISFYGLGFDLKMLNTRLLYWGEGILPPRMHIDVYRLVKRHFNTSRRNLDTICSHFGIKGKTHIDLEYWKQAKILGNKQAIKYIVDHNIADCEILERLFYKVKSLIKSISLA